MRVEIVMFLACVAFVAGNRAGAAHRWTGSPCNCPDLAKLEARGLVSRACRSMCGGGYGYGYGYGHGMKSLGHQEEAPEIVYLHDLNDDHDKRNLNCGMPAALKFNLRHGGGDIELNLQENKRVNQMAPMYVADPQHSNKVKRAVCETNRRVRYYQDKRNGAYLVGECEDNTHGPCTRKLTGNLHVNGREYKLEPSTADKRSFSANLGTTHTMTLLKRKSLATRGVGNMAVSHSYDYAVEPDTEKVIADEMAETKADTETLLKQLLTRLDEGAHHAIDKRASPVQHGVEMLMVLDHGIYQMFQGMYSNESTILMKIREYFSHILNGVDLRYMSIDENDVSFYVTVVGFFISKSEYESPWMTYNNGNPDGLTGLQNMIEWRKNTEGLPEHDHAALITGFDIEYQGSSNVVGLAYLNGVCNDYRVSLNEEYGFFEGAGVLAHELGHNLGAPHDDGSSNGPCDPGRQFVMAPYVPYVSSGTTNTEPWHFSSCSVESFRSYVNGLGTTSCTLDDPDIYDEGEFNDNTDYLAGTQYTEDEQCELLLGSGATMCTSNKNTDDVCRNFQCQPAGGSYCSSYVAAYGTPCGNGKICYNGLCQAAECKGRQCTSGTDTPSTGTTPTATQTPTTDPTTQTPFECVDNGLAGYTCDDLREVMGGTRAMCSKFTRECCQTCTQSKFCKKEKIIKLGGNKKYTCSEMVDEIGFTGTCQLFTDRCCMTCAY